MFEVRWGAEFTALSPHLRGMEVSDGETVVTAHTLLGVAPSVASHQRMVVDHQDPDGRCVRGDFLSFSTEGTRLQYISRGPSCQVPNPASKGGAVVHPGTSSIKAVAQ